MAVKIIALAFALTLFAVESSAGPGASRGAHNGGGRPATSQNHYRRDSMHRRDAMNRTRKDAHERGSLHRADPETKGDATAVDMRARRDQRRAIQEGYRATREPGQEGTRGEREPQKKPWWKF